MHHRLLLCISMSIGLSLNLLASQDQEEGEKPALSVDDSLKLTSVGDVLIDPAGEHVFYSLRRLDWPKNSWRRSYYLASIDTGESRPYLAEDAGGFRFSPRGTYFTFLRETGQDESGQADQLFLMRTAGGEARQLTHHRGGVFDYKWLRDESAIIFLSEVQQDGETEKERRLGDDAFAVDAAPHGKNFARYSSLWRFDLAEGKEHSIRDLELVVGSFDVSPDGKQIVLSARPDRRTNYIWEAELYLLSSDGQHLRQMTRNRAPEDDPLWSPDGRMISFRAPSDGEFELRVGYFWILDTQTSQLRRLEGQRTGEVTGSYHWSPDSRALVYNEIHGTDTNLYRMDVATGVARAVTNRKGTVRLRGLSRDHQRMVYTYENFSTPPDLWAGDANGDQLERITDANPWIRERRVSQGQVVAWKSKGEMVIEGVYHPALTGSDQSPLILNIHGGPAGVAENAFRADFQVLNGLGYAVLAPNFRGSTGYGDIHLRGLMGEVGDGEYVDLMTGVDHVIEHFGVDESRLGLRGWSWGGVSASYTITRTNRFKAASIGAMVGNWAAETGPGFNFDVSLWYIGSTPWDDPQEWRKRSSISFVKNVTTPSILFHGGADQTSSVGQSLMFFTALRDIGKAPVRYIKFPRQGHGIREPRHRRRLMIEEIQWFKKYLQGLQWTAPAFEQ